MLVRSVIYGWGFDFMRPFQNSGTSVPEFFYVLAFWFGIG